MSAASRADLLIGAHDWFGSRAVLPAAHLLDRGSVVIGAGARRLYDRFGVRYDEVVNGPEDYFDLVDEHAGPFIGPVPTMYPLSNPDAAAPDRMCAMSDQFRPRNSAHAIPAGSWETGAPILLLKGPNYDARSLHYTGKRKLIKGYGPEVDCWREEKNVELLPVEGLYYAVFAKLAPRYPVAVAADVVWFDRGVRVADGELLDMLSEIAAERELTVVRNANQRMRAEHTDAFVPWLENKMEHPRLVHTTTDVPEAVTAPCRAPVEAEDYQRVARFVLGIENCFSGGFLMASMFADTYALWYHETADRVFVASEARGEELRKAMQWLTGTGRITKVERGCDFEGFAFPRPGFAGDPIPTFVQRVRAMLTAE